MRADPKIVEILYRALMHPIGVLLRTNNIFGLRRALQSARAADPALANLEFRTSELPDGNLAIVHAVSADADDSDA